MLARIDVESIPFQHQKAFGPPPGDFSERRCASWVSFDGDDAARAFQQQRACEPAGTWSDFHDLTEGAFIERTRCAGDPPCQAQVQEKVLTERLSRRQTMGRDDAREWRQAVFGQSLVSGLRLFLR